MSLLITEYVCRLKQTPCKDLYANNYTHTTNLKMEGLKDNTNIRFLTSFSQFHIITHQIHTLE